MFLWTIILIFCVEKEHGSDTAQSINHLSSARVADSDSLSCYETFYTRKLGQICATASSFRCPLRALAHIWIFWKVLIKGCIANVQIFIDIWIANDSSFRLFATTFFLLLVRLVLDANFCLLFLSIMHQKV